jgi:hypothetical protein
LSEEHVLRQDRAVNDQPSPFAIALDLLVYAPVGLALTISEEVPKLAAKGRSRLRGPLGTALVVGRFAVQQGRRQVERKVDATSRAPSSPAAAPADVSAAGEEPQVAPADPAPGVVFVASSPSEDVPAASSLAIPGYDSLSASQVVQRLAGLSLAELEAVGAYETARRGRRTILTRVAQLQAR